MITHGHGDHYGGMGYLQWRYGARAAMSEADWTLVETKLEFDRPDRGGEPHPFVLGQEKVVCALTVMNKCARATREVWAA